MRHLAILALTAALLGGCFAGKIYKHTAGRVYSKVGKVYARITPSLPAGSVRVDAVATPAPLGFSTPSAQDVAMVTQLVEQDHRRRAERPVRRPRAEPQREETPRPRREDRAPQNISNDVSYQHTVKQAPRYPSSPFVAMYPVKKGSNERVCKKFQQSADNKNDCMVECRAQLMSGPGSCTCMEMTECPGGVRVVDR